MFIIFSKISPRTPRISVAGDRGKALYFSVRQQYAKTDSIETWMLHLYALEIKECQLAVQGLN